jgi:trehalose 6-phosphate phosphatase
MQYVFKKLDTLKERLKGKYLFIFLDYDGTLTPIVKTPDRAILSSQTREVLRKLSENPSCKVAIISGRSLEDIKNMLTLKSVIYSGNHGLEIEGPKLRFITPISETYRKVMTQIKDELTGKIASFKGAFIEDKGLSLTLHFRLVKPKQIPLLKTAFHETVILRLVANKIKIKAGKKVLEVRPILEWDKGKVVLWLFGRQKCCGTEAEILPVYIGDDLTDEDAFKALQHLGITIFVGKPKPSYAHYYLKNPDEVRELLEMILKLQEETGRCQN